MPILQSLKQTQRDAVVDVLHGTLPTPLANTCTPSQNSVASGFPSNPVGLGGSAFPSRVSLTTLELGLPLSHTGRIAECERGVKISRRACDLLAAPIARLRDTVGAARVRLPDLPLLPTLERTVFLVALPCADAGFSANFTRRTRGCTTPSIRKVASARTEAGFGATVKRMKIRAAMIASQCAVWVYHALSIPHIEIEERYCEIAVNRLRQEVFQFEEPKAEPEQMGLEAL